MPEIPGYPGGKKPKRAGKAVRLDASGITEAQLTLYKSCFTMNRRYGLHVVRDTYPGAKWTSVNWPFQERDILMHLTQEHIIGLRWSNYVKCVAIDIDCHFRTQDSFFVYHPGNERMESIIKAFGGAKPLIVQSSDSQGLHLYYFLEKEVHIRNVEFSIDRLFNNAGIQIRSGWIEHATGTTNRALRLPLGEGSHILQYEDLTPVGRSLGQQLQYLEHRLEDFTYRFEDLVNTMPRNSVYTDLDDDSVNGNSGQTHNSSQAVVALTDAEGRVYPRADDSCESRRKCDISHDDEAITDKPPLSRGRKYFAPIKLNRTDYVSKKEHSSTAPVQEQFQTAMYALKNGLETEGTRQHITLCIVTYTMLKLGFSKLQAKKFIKSWIRDKHNGKSKDWNAGPRKQQEIFEDIERLVDKWKQRESTEVSSLTLTADEIHNIHKLDATLQEKVWIAEFYSKVKPAIRQNPSEPLELTHFWFQRIWECTAGTATKRINTLIRLGILVLETNYSDKAHGRIWKVNNVTTEIGLYTTFCEGLDILFSREELKQTYSKAQLRRLREQFTSPHATKTEQTDPLWQDKAA